MKQEIISYMSTIKDLGCEISKFIYDNPEKDYVETKCSNFLCDILSGLNFKVEKNYMDIPNSFVATSGNGHPKACFICQFGTSQETHTHGINLVSSIAILSAAGLSKVLDSISGKVIVLGCSGALTCDSIVTMFKQEALDDIDFISLVQPNTVNSEKVSSPTVFPYESFNSNPTIARLFAHNLKENGIIDIIDNHPISTGTGLGIVSTKIPCIYPLISIVQDKNITFPSEEFGRLTLTDYAQDKVMKASQSLAFTALDLFEKQDLLMEAKCETSKL